MHHEAGGGSVFLGVLHGLLALAFLVLVVLACIWLIRQLLAGGPAYRDPAEQDLRRRYAAGEVEREDYLTRMADLREQKPQSSSSQ
ncbi:hypothetical protein MOQ72_25910 [Saccharopolyspora sp. K220]|uniref:hypothetical protein n=1 Tax=Saccharopolyspora soli TaxID=2926618 RepID=UPI001F58A317|nr:hypothetical protein [Saccharopolyspora soli]MCI2420889.1 hypothetical protein [Saccharopolyspora soli]